MSNDTQKQYAVFYSSLAWRVIFQSADWIALALLTWADVRLFDRIIPGWALVALFILFAWSLANSQARRFTNAADVHADVDKFFGAPRP